MPLNLGKGCSRMVPIGAQRKRKTKKKEHFLEEEEDRGLVERRASPSAGRAHIAEYVHESWSICELELCDERYSRRLSSVSLEDRALPETQQQRSTLSLALEATTVLSWARHAMGNGS